MMVDIFNVKEVNNTDWNEVIYLLYLEMPYMKLLYVQMWDATEQILWRADWMLAVSPQHNRSY